MGSPPPRSLWVGVLAVLAAVLEFPVVLQKCIFDEVQAQAGLVRAAPLEAGLAARTGPETVHPRRRAIPTYYLSERRRKSLRKTAPPVPASPQPIRIRCWTSRESGDLSEAENERLEAAVSEAVRRVSSLLSVNRVVGPLLLSRDVNKYCKFLWKNASAANHNRCGGANSSYRSETCLDVTIPDDHLAGCHIYKQADSPRRTELRPDGAGLHDTDFLLYLHIQTTAECRSEPNVLAYAVHCQTDGQGRPVAGVVVICRDRLTGATYSHQSAVQTVIHELFHALGFSKQLFHTWRDCSSSSPGGTGCSPRGKVTHPDASGQMRIYSPSVIAALQKHLVSADPELGGPLENLDAPSGRASSHWESRVLRGSIMVAALGDSTTVWVDPLTLAAFQDTGWYTVNLSRAQSLVWGAGEGSLFGSLSTCHDNSSSFFCNGSGLGCHYLHLHKGACRTDPYLEGCGVYEPLKNGSECWKEENGGGSAEQDWSGEMFGFGSRCFFSSLTTQSPLTPAAHSVGPRCYRHRCTGPNHYQIQVSGSGWVDCPAGGAIQIEGYQGSVSCPDRRLCLYADAAPPPNDVNASHASVTSDETLPLGQSGTGLPPGAATALYASAAATCLLAAVVAFGRRWFCCGVRIHQAPRESQ